MSNCKTTKRPNLSDCADDAVLTEEERSALVLSAIGLSVASVAEVMARPPEMVRASLRSAIEKLGAHSKLEAVLIGLRKGVIELPGS